MALPKKKRGFRTIVVDEISYDWRFNKLIDIRVSTKPRSKLLIDINWKDPWLQDWKNQPDRHLIPCSIVISPAFVAMAIKESIKLGWKPKQDYARVILNYRNEVFSLITKN